MNSEIHDNVLRELECICNKCIVGDVTVAVFDILKTTSDLEGLCKELNVKTKRHVQTVTNTISMFDQLLNAGVKLE